MKFFILLGLLAIGSAFATDDNISSACLRSSSRYMREGAGKAYCSNVANNCFSALNPQDGFYEARDKCVNVSHSCFKDISFNRGPRISADICSNVTTRCYNQKREHGFSVQASIKACRF